MAYRGRTLPPAPAPPITKHSPITSTNDSTLRSRSISNISRLSHSSKSSDSVQSRSSSISNTSTNMDNFDSLTTANSLLLPTSDAPNNINNNINNNNVNSNNTLLDEYELSKIEMFYRSHRTFVYVGQCLVTLYFTETELYDNDRQSRPKCNEWRQYCIGVPVLLFNRGDTRSRDKRQIQICIAEYGTGFKLWSDVIDNLSNYQTLKSTFHTMYLSTNHRQMAGLKFDNQLASLEFYNQVEIITSNPLNIALTGPKSVKKNSDEKFRIFRKQRSKSVGRTKDVHHQQQQNKNSLNIQSPYYDDDYFHNDNNRNNQSNRLLKSNRKPATNKMDISAPCLFQHITSVNLNNFNQFDSTIVENQHHHSKQQHQQTMIKMNNDSDQSLCNDCHNNNNNQNNKNKYLEQSDYSTTYIYQNQLQVPINNRSSSSSSSTMATSSSTSA